MASKIRIDLDALASTSDDLAKIANEFDDTDTMVDMVTSAIGATNETHELRAAVEHFAGTWRIRREKVRENVRYLAQTSASVAENLAAADTDLATSLTEAATSTTPSMPPNLGRGIV